MKNIQKSVLLGVCMVLFVGTLDFVHAQAVPAVIGHPMPIVDVLESPSGVCKAVSQGTYGNIVYWDYNGDGIVDAVYVQWIDQIPWIIIITPE